MPRGKPTLNLSAVDDTGDGWEYEAPAVPRGRPTLDLTRVDETVKAEARGGLRDTRGAK